MSYNIMSSVAEFHCCTRESFQSDVYPIEKPALLKGLDLDPAVSLWGDVDYLSATVGDRPVKIHVCPSSKMDFIGRNFIYRTLPFNELVHRCSQAAPRKDFFMSQDELYYLRAVGDDPRKDIASISADYPSLSKDLVLPPFFPEYKLFSSVLRVSSPGLQLWTHYDVMDNFLIQIVGRKRVVLFPPSSLPYLYLKGDKSAVLDVDNPDLSLFPKFPEAERIECELGPGDVLFMPALWFHNVTSLDYGVAVNTFWKGLDHKFYDSKDTYGNKDPPQVQRSLQVVDRAIGLLDELPQTFKDFYGHRLIARIEEKMRQS